MSNKLLVQTRCRDISDRMTLQIHRAWEGDTLSSAKRLYKLSARGGNTQLPSTRSTMRKFLLVRNLTVRHFQSFSI